MFDRDEEKCRRMKDDGEMNEVVPVDEHPRTIDDVP
jgi:hypothetical protein